MMDNVLHNRRLGRAPDTTVEERIRAVTSRGKPKADLDQHLFEFTAADYRRTGILALDEELKQHREKHGIKGLPEAASPSARPANVMEDAYFFDQGASPGPRLETEAPGGALDSPSRVVLNQDTAAGAQKDS